MHSHHRHATSLKENGTEDSEGHKTDSHAKVWEKSLRQKGRTCKGPETGPNLEGPGYSKTQTERDAGGAGVAENGRACILSQKTQEATAGPEGRHHWFTSVRPARGQCVESSLG